MTDKPVTSDPDLTPYHPPKTRREDDKDSDLGTLVGIEEVDEPGNPEVM